MTIDCLICCEKQAFMTIGKCGHVNNCLECSFKFRSDQKNQKCIYCNTLTDKVVVIPNTESHYSKNFSDFESMRLTHFDHGIYFHDHATRDACQKLKRLTCPMPNCKDKDRQFYDIEQLKEHVRKQHRRYFCDLCLKHRKLLVSQQKIYRKEELKKHLEQGDFDSEGALTFMHPHCSFCNEYQFNEESFLNHMRQEHIKCHVCKGKKFKYIYYKNYQTMSVHFNESHFACKEQACIDKAFVVFRSEAELLNHYEHEHISSKSSNSRRKNKGKVIKNIGEATEIVIRDNQGEDISHKLLSHLKAKRLGENQGSQELVKKMDLLEMFQMLFNIKVYESLLIEQELVDEENAKDIGDDEEIFWFYRHELFDRVNGELKGEKYKMDDEIREYIKHTHLEKARIKKLNRNKKKSKIDEDDDLVYNKNTEKPSEKEAKRERCPIEKRDQMLRVEDIIFKRWETGHEIDWNTFEEKAGNVVNYKGREDMDYYTYEFINDKLQADQLFDAFIDIFSFKYSFRYFYLFLMTVRKPRRRKALADVLYKRLRRVRFRKKNIIIGKRNFQDLFAEMTRRLKENILTRYKANSMRKFEGIHTSRLYQFLKSVKTLKSNEILRLKFLGMYLSDEMALHKIQKAFWMDHHNLNRWLSGLGNLDCLISYLYFYMVGLMYSNKPISIKLKSNPNLIKVFFRINRKECDDFEYDIDSEEEDYELYEKELERKRKLEAAREKKRNQMQRDRKGSMHSRDSQSVREKGAEEGKKKGGHWAREDQKFSFKKEDKVKKTVNLKGVPQKVKNVFERDENQDEVDLDNKFDFPTLGGGSNQPRGKFSYTNKKMAKKKEANPEQFPTLGGSEGVYNPVPKKAKKKATKNTFQKSSAYKPPEDYPSLNSAPPPSTNIIVKKSKKKKKKNNKNQNWNDVTPSIMGGTKRQKKKQIEQDFPTLGDEVADVQDDFIERTKKVRVKPNRMNVLEQKYGKNDVNFLEKTGHEIQKNGDSISIMVGTKKKKKRKRKR